MSFNTEENIEDDHYTFLGIKRDATESEITNAYRKLSRLYHPDKHDSTKENAANILFNRTKKAYEILSDPHKRAIYDTLGEKAIDNQMLKLVKYTKTPEEIRENYENLLKEREEQQLKQLLNPRGTVTFGINATNLFKQSTRKNGERRKKKHNEEGSMGISAAIDLPISHKNIINLACFVSSQNGKGSHSFTCGLKKTFLEDLQTEWQLSGGQTNFLKFKGVKNLTKKDYIGTSLIFSPQLLSFFRKEFNYGHYLSKYVEFNMAFKTDLINESSFSTSLIYNKENNKLDLEFKIGIKSSHLSLAYIRSLGINETKLKTKLKLGLIETSSIEFGCETKLTKHASVDAIISISNATGVSIKLACMIPNQVYALDIKLSDEIILAPIIYGAICPMVAYLCVKKFLIQPYHESQENKKKQETNIDKLKKMYEKKKEAELSINLMKDSYLRIVQNERTKLNGLIIDVAIYGDAENLVEFVNKNVRNVLSENLNNNEELINKRLILVTVPLQCLINDSIILLPESSKSNLPGFYDVSPNTEKKLYIRYKFRQNIKEVLISDKDKLRLPTYS